MFSKLMETVCFACSMYLLRHFSMWQRGKPALMLRVIPAYGSCVTTTVSYR